MAAQLGIRWHLSGPQDLLLNSSWSCLQAATPTQLEGLGSLVSSAGLGPLGPCLCAP